MEQMDHDAQPDMAEFFNFAAASMPEESSQLNLAGAFSSSDVLNSVMAPCPVHPEGTKYAQWLVIVVLILILC
jgi:hypothetical protein